MRVLAVCQARFWGSILRVLRVLRLFRGAMLRELLVLAVVGVDTASMRSISAVKYCSYDQLSQYSVSTANTHYTGLCCCTLCSGLGLLLCALCTLLCVCGLWGTTIISIKVYKGCFAATGRGIRFNEPVPNLAIRYTMTNSTRKQ